MRVLCVAEKPSIAKAITQILSGGQYNTRSSPNKYIKNYDFSYPQARADFTVTSVTGHLMEHEFDAMYNSWQSCDPFVLFDAPIEQRVKENHQGIAKNLTNEAKKAQKLMIWTDCDREGENIGAEVATVCKKVKRDIEVRRARFSAIIAQQIHHAAQNPVMLDMAQAKAVEARIILDLRIGAAFTRFQTLGLRARFVQFNQKLISYGPCQFPTLGFVVSRYNQVKNFRSEPFWFIFLSASRQSPDGQIDDTVFTWKRGHLFSFTDALILYEHVLTDRIARVVKVTNKDTKKWKPLPLTTVDLQKAGSRILKISPKRVLDIAESLYNQGFLSYPRTETDQFDPQFDFMTLIGKQAVDPAWGAFATGLQNGGFNVPRKGKKNDKAHPPIHPTAHVANLGGDDKRVYEYITRRFLACCAKDALGWQTTVDVEYGQEEFYATGLIVKERNYLEVFPYDKWSDKELPHFVEGEEFQPSVCELREGKTSKPPLLTEADLVNLMDKNGIGTDATIAQHIQTIEDRKYVCAEMRGATKYLIPSKLGFALVEGYNEIGFDRSLSKPQLRRETERHMVQICEGTKSKSDMLVENIEKYKEIFMRIKREFNKIHESVTNRVQGGNGDDAMEFDHNDEEGDGDGGGGGGGSGRGGGGGGRGGGGNGGGQGRGQRGGRGNSRGVGRAARRGASSSCGVPPPPPPPPPPALDDDDEAAYWDSPPPPQRVQPPRSTGHRCDCGVPAAERTMTSEGANKGRHFRCCGNNNTCSFWEWADGPAFTAGFTNTNAPAPKVIPAKRSVGQRNSGQSRLCQCENTAVLKVTQSGPNEGRNYWSCPNMSLKGRCGFFEWADSDEDVPTGGTRARGQSFGNEGRATTGECYNCHQEGHWASACPDNGPTPPKRTKSTGNSSNSGATSQVCFKCHKSGHFASACPNRAVGQGSQTNLDGVTCFKCGQEGHYSNSCPNDGQSGRASVSGRGGKRGRGRGSRTRATSSRGGRSRKKSNVSATDDSF